MPVLQRVTKVFRKRRGSVDISPVFRQIVDISGPTNVTHDCHVGFEDGEFVNLPSSWKQWLQKSKITCVSCLYLFNFSFFINSVIL